MPIECEQCKKRIVASGISHNEKWFCSLKCLKEYKVAKTEKTQ